MINKIIFNILALLLPIACYGDRGQSVECDTTCSAIKAGYESASQAKLEYKSQCKHDDPNTKQGCLNYIVKSQEGSDIGYTLKNGEKDTRQVLMGKVRNLYICSDEDQISDVSLFEMQDSIGKYGVISITDGELEANINNTEFIVANFSRHGLSKRWDWDLQTADAKNGEYRYSMIRDDDGRTLYYHYLKDQNTAKPYKIYYCRSR